MKTEQSPNNSLTSSGNKGSESPDKRKRILFTGLRMNVGGVEKAMISLMRQLDPREYDLHLALIYQEGGFMKELPDYVTVHEIKGLYSKKENIHWISAKSTLLRLLFTRHFLTALVGLWHYAVSLCGKSLAHYAKWLMRNSKPGKRHADAVLDGEFDLAIDFPGPPGEYIELYIAEHIKAKRKVAWLHFNLEKVHLRHATSRRVYRRMDKIYCVSQQAAQQLQTAFPEFKDKIEVFHNIINSKEILKYAQKTLAPDIMEAYNSHYNVVTVGRVTHIKGQDIAVRALAKLVGKGYKNLFWHFIGGEDKIAEYSALAAELGVSENCRFYGADANPYPYMQLADIYVQPSRSEGFCITIGEARLFGMPIVATDFVGAHEQLSADENAQIIPIVEDIETQATLLADAVEKAMSMPRREAGDASANPYPHELVRFKELIAN